MFAQIDGTWLVIGDLNGGKNQIAGRADNLYGELNFYAPVANADNAQFIRTNAPDAVFDQRVVVNGVATVAPVAGATVTQNLVKFGSVIAPDDELDQMSEADVEAALPVAVPEPGSALLVLAGLAGAAAARRRRVDLEARGR